jgi:hypothetical protein
MINNSELLELEKYIINLKHPTIFLFKLLKYNVDDITSSYIVRIFLKYHSIYACQYNIATIFNNTEYPHTINILIDFYNLIKQKTILLMVVQKWVEQYDNKNFWDIDLNQQILFLKQMQHYFKSIFDCANGGLPFYYRVFSLLNNMYKAEMMQNIEERLLLVLGVFDKKIFTYLDIPLIHVSEFYELSPKDIIQYLSTIYTKFTKLVNNVINIFQVYRFINDRLILLYNPIINENSDSETTSDDIELFC